MLSLLFRRSVLRPVPVSRGCPFSSGASASDEGSSYKLSNPSAGAGTTFSELDDTPNGDAEVETLVTESLRHVESKGWTDSAIRAAVADLSWSPAAAGMLPGGAGEIALRFVSRCNVKLAQDLSSPSSTGNSEQGVNVAPTAPTMDGREKRLLHAVRTRLEMVAPYQHNWGSALALLTQPAQARGAALQSALLADELAHFAGYHEPQFTWYVDRGVICALYGATELFWLTDKSPGQIDTWQFLESQIERAEGLRSGTASAFDSIMSAADLSAATISSIMSSMRRRY